MVVSLNRRFWRSGGKPDIQKGLHNHFSIMNKFEKKDKLREKALQLIEKYERKENGDKYESIDKILEELSIHQIELELQNDELTRTSQELENTQSRYMELFNEAPVAYFILNRTGNFYHFNRSAQKILGKPGFILRNVSMTTFVDDKHKSAFYLHIKKTFETEELQSAEIKFINVNKQVYYLQLQSKSYYDSHYNERLIRTTAMDITEQKQLYEKLQESEERFHTIFEKDELAKLLINPQDGQIVDANQAAEKFYGYSAEELRSLNIDKINTLPPDELREKIHNAVHREKNVFRFEHRLKSGDLRNVEVYAQPLKIGGTTFLMSIVHDITEQIKTKEDFIRSKNFLDTIIENLPLGLQIFDKNGVSRRMNIKHSELLGLSNTQVGVNSFNVLTDPYSIANKAAEVYERVYNGETILNREHKYIFDIPENKWETQKRTKFFNETIFPIFDSEGNVISVVALLNDITARKETERKLKETEERWNYAFIAIGDGVWDWNLITNELFFSNTWKTMLGYTEEEIPNRLSEWEKRVHPKDIEKAKEDIRKHIAGETGFYSNEHRLQCKNGTYKWVLDRGRVIEWTEKGEPKRFIGTHTDISRLKEVEQKLVELNVTKDKFFSIISHDLRSPFANLLGLTELLIFDFEQYDTEKIKEFHQNIYKSAKAAYTLLENLLEWSRSQRGIIKFAPRRINLKNVLTEALGVYQSAAQKKNITIENKVKYDIIVFADYDMSMAILRNLLSNAIKYTQKGGKIFIYTEIIDNKVNISIKDTGVGIAQKNLKNLFSIESNYSTRGTEQEPGTGLGLILCKEFVEKHGGEIRAESEKGKGSIFSFSLPLANQNK